MLLLVHICFLSIPASNNDQRRWYYTDVMHQHFSPWATTLFGLPSPLQGNVDIPPVNQGLNKPGHRSSSLCNWCVHLFNRLQLHLWPADRWRRRDHLHFSPPATTLLGLPSAFQSNINIPPVNQGLNKLGYRSIQPIRRSSSTVSSYTYDLHQDYPDFLDSLSLRTFSEPNRRLTPLRC